MRERVNRWLAISLSLLALSGIFAIASTRLFSTWHLISMVVAIVLTPIGEYLDRNHRWYRRLTFAITLLFTLTLPLWFAVLGVYRGVVALVVFILVHKFIHGKKSRDFYQIVIMSFALLLAAGSHQPSAGIAPALFLFFGAVVFSLMGIHAWREMDGTSSRVLLFGFSVEKKGSPAEASSPYKEMGMMRWCFQILAICLLLTTGLFLATPRIEGGLIRFQESNTATTGTSTLIELAEMGPILPDSSLVMRVRFPEEIRPLPLSALYWRVTTFHDVFGTRWERAAISSAWMDALGGEQFVQVDDYTIQRTSPRQGRRRIYQQISLELAHSGGLPVLNVPVQVRSADARLYWDPQHDYTVKTRDPAKPMTYEAWSYIPSFSAEELRRAPFDYGSVGARDLGFLTHHSLSRRAVELTRELTANEDTVFDKVAALERWFHSDAFQYTLNPPRYYGANPITVFLTQTRAGNCQHFAIAMAMMVRSLGIPARVVSGYRGGDWDEATRTLFVRSDAAHLWVEVYFVGFGWVPFDPTPSSDELSERRNRSIWSTNRFLLWLQYMWYRNVEGYQTTALWRGIVFLARALAAARFGIPGFGLIVLALLLGLLGVIAARFIKTWRRGGILVFPSVESLSPDQRRAQRLYRFLKKELRRAGIKCDGLTATEILATAQESNILSPETLKEVVAVYHRARFGGGKMSVSDYRTAARHLRTARIR